MIQLVDVHIALAGHEVLRGVSIDIADRDRLVILGASGAGKSTILKAVLGLLPPDRGKVVVEGRNLRSFTEEEFLAYRRKLAMVFQGGALFDSLTVGENVGYRLFEEGRLSPAEVEEVVREKLAAVDLEEAIDLYPSQLSGGMRKRTAIARALAGDPNCIFFDEPTAGLDPVVAQTVNDLIIGCQRQGKGTVVVTHDLDCAFRVGEHLMFIHDGAIVFDGDRKGLLASEVPVVAEFLHPEGAAEGGCREA